ncbi:Transcription elongation factor B polypeptide 3 [Myotis brandtii]|uniref:Transcription elongation factor B polypeptide 3 n=1 Tax=Myotis brandtii TaxID=109478 RepID=S7PHB1_MYOBR|nr:Transcription elongation factor B polypeptide 3 [Myotis brandtii]
MITMFGQCVQTLQRGKSLRTEDTTSAQAEAGQSEKPFPPAAAGARLTQVPPAASPAWPDLGPCRGQPSDPPLPAFASMSSFQPRPRAPPSPGEEEGAGLMGIRLNSGTQVFSGSQRARRRKGIAMLQQCVQTLQDSVTLLSQLRGVPCSLLQPAVEGYTPEQLPGLEEHHGAPAAETDASWKKQCHRALEKERREEHTAQLQPQEQEVPELVLHTSANRPQDPPAEMAFSDSSEGGGGAAVQEKALPAPAPTAGTRAPSHPASGHSCRPIPGKQVVSSHKKPVKKIAPLMAKSVKDYKIRCHRR